MPQTQVYPRWRGEHCMALASSLTDAGLSPLARGTHISEQKTKPQPRFIPAGAGNTYKTRTHPPRGAVYPRWRGEHSTATPVANGARGLSPLARGTLLQCQQSFPDCRFIPAGAGNTRRWHRQTPVLSVYPRWRGEHYRDRFWNLQRGGLSPLARGTQ